MGRETDALLLHQAYDQDEENAKKVEQARRVREIDQAKAELRLLREMAMTGGYKLYMQYLSTELGAAFRNMDRTESPLDHTRTAGSYTALRKAYQYVEERIQELTEQLAGIEVA